MSLLFIPASNVTPEIQFNIDRKEFSISGYSRPEDVDRFYTQIFDWVFDNTNTIAELEELEVVLDLVYFNSSSAKQILRLLSRINFITKGKAKYEWHYDIEDEELLESGKEFSRIIKSGFTYIAK